MNWRDTKYETEFVHIPTNTNGPKIDNHWFGVSPNNRWIASGSWDITVSDLKSQNHARVLRSFHLPSNDFKLPRTPAKWHSFSADGRLLAVSDREFVYVIDVDKDVCVAKKPMGNKSAARWTSPISDFRSNEAIVGT